MRGEKCEQELRVFRTLRPEDEIAARRFDNADVAHDAEFVRTAWKSAGGCGMMAAARSA
jgi:hypothetical protein